MRFELSPHPSVVLVVEGEAEMRLVPRVMEMLGVRQGPGAVKLMKAGSATMDLQLLAEYAAAPELGEELGDGVELVRPPVRFIVVMDPEEKFKSQGDRDRQSRIWVRRIYEAIPPERRTAVMRDEMAGLVEVRTWNEEDEPFEFANWTDEEIATALTVLCKRKHDGIGGPVTPEDVARLRVGDRNLNQLWQRATRGRGKEVPKVELAEELWPTLERKVREVVDGDSMDHIPVARLVWRVGDLVRTTLRSDVMIRR